MIQPHYLTFLMQAARSQNSSSSTPFTNPSYSCRRYKHFLSCKLSGQCLQKEYNLQVFSISFFTYYVQQITCKDEHSHMQGKISNIYRKNNFQDRNTIPKVYLHLSILQHNRMFILTNKLSEKLETLGNVSQHFSSEKDPSKILSDIHTILLCVASQQTTLECKKKKIALTLTKCSNGHCCGSVVQIFL